MRRPRRQRWVRAAALPWLVALAAGCSATISSSAPRTGGEGRMYPAVVAAGDTIEIGYFLDNKGAATPYKIGVGDVLRIHVTDYPELSRDDVAVLPDGRISLNLIGSVAIAGQTVEEAAAEIAARYLERKVRRPEVVVAVTKGQQRVKQLLESIGGDRGVNRLELKVFDQPFLELPFIPPVALGRSLVEIRRDIKQAYEREFGTELQVTVNVASRLAPTLYVMGEVKKPGSIEAYPGVSLAAAVATAGGFADTANRGEVLVLRFKPDGSYDYWTFDLTERALTERHATDFPLERADVVYVAKSRIAQVNQFVELYIRKNMPFSVGFGGLIPFE